MRSRNPPLTVWVLCAAALLGSCSERRGRAQLTIAAAANLTEVFAEIGRGFTAKTGIEVIFSYGSTAQLAQQVENGAPFDLFVAADTDHVDALVSAKKLIADSRAIYAVGQLALWIPNGEQTGIRELKDLTKQQVHFISVAQPELAPYGQATIEVLKNAGLWGVLEPRVVYANSISQARQLAASGNADAAFTAYSLLLHDRGTIVNIDRKLYRPIEQALGIVVSSTLVEQANQFRSFLLGPEGRAILTRGGYLLPYSMVRPA